MMHLGFLFVRAAIRRSNIGVKVIIGSIGDLMMILDPPIIRAVIRGGSNIGLSAIIESI
jgi:hypothetical protein